MNQGTCRLVRLVGAIGVIGLTVGACGQGARTVDAAPAAAGDSASSAPMSAPSQEPVVGEVPVVTDWHQITLPLDRYQQTVDEIVTVERAEDVRIAGCMRRFGLSWQVPPNPRSVPAGAGDQAVHYRRYGLLDAEHAATYGYHPGPIVGGKGEEADGNRPTPSPAWYNVFNADQGGGTYQGKRIPAGGCLGEAQRALAGGGVPADDPVLVEQLAARSDQWSQADSRVRAAFERWSQCMADAGYDYDTPMAANDDDRWSTSDPARPAPGETAAATADVRCKVRTNLVGVRMAVDAAYQRLLIQQHQDQLDAFTTMWQRQVRNAALTLPEASQG